MRPWRPCAGDVGARDGDVRSRVWVESRRDRVRVSSGLAGLLSGHFVVGQLAQLESSATPSVGPRILPAVSLFQLFPPQRVRPATGSSIIVFERASFNGREGIASKMSHPILRFCASQMVVLSCRSQAALSCMVEFEVEERRRIGWARPLRPPNKDQDRGATTLAAGD